MSLIPSPESSAHFGKEEGEGEGARGSEGGGEEGRERRLCQASTKKGKHDDKVKEGCEGWTRGIVRQIGQMEKI